MFPMVFWMAMPPDPPQVDVAAIQRQIAAREAQMEEVRRTTAWFEANLRTLQHWGKLQDEYIRRGDVHHARWVTLQDELKEALRLGKDTTGIQARGRKLNQEMRDNHDWYNEEIRKHNEQLRKQSEALRKP